MNLYRRLMDPEDPLWNLPVWIGLVGIALGIVGLLVGVAQGFR